MSAHKMVTFYIPLSRPMRLPAGEGVWLERDEPLEWLQQYFPHSEWKLPSELYETRSNFVLVRVAQVQSSSVSIDVSALNLAFEVAADDIGHEKPSKGDPSNDHMPVDLGPDPVVVQTILIVSTPVVVYDVAPLEELISWAFDRCIDSARQYEMAYAIESDDLIYMPLTRVTCSPQVPYALYDFVDHAHGELGVFLVHEGFGYWPDYGPPLEKPQVDRLRSRFGRITRQDPWNIFVIMSRAANRSLEVEGDFASAVIQAYTSGESMLDTFLQSMAWESLTFDAQTQITEDEVVSWFSQRSTLHTRMNTIFPRMLEKWNMGKQDGACYKWITNVAKLRNRIVHGGYEPKESQAREATETVRALEDEVKTILLSDRNRCRYPRTTFLWIGRVGLQKRSLYNGQLKRLAEDNPDRDWVGDFIEFRKSLDEKLWPFTGPAG